MSNKMKMLISKQFRKKADKNAKKIGEFFSVQPPTFEVEIAVDRNIFNHLINQSFSEPWLVGKCLCINGTPRIILLHPEEIVREGIHISKDIDKIFVHEVVHLVFEQIYPFSEPLWLKEGIAVYLSRQCPVSRFDLKTFSQKGNFPLSLTTKEQWEKLRRFGAYGIAGKFIEFLIREFGKRSFNLWVQSLPKEKFYQDSFLRQFELFYKKPLVLMGKKFLNSLQAKGGEENES